MSNSQPERSLRANFWEAYYHELETLEKSYAIPGHKGRVDLVGDLVARDRPVSLSERRDIPSIALLAEAEVSAADLWGADYCRFSVNGSSAANQAAICTVVGPGDSIIISRSTHKSALFGLIYSGADPIWLPPEIAPNGTPLGVSPQSLSTTLQNHPEAKAVFVGSPSYVGTLSDITELSNISHDSGIPLIVDCAWGGHFGFHPLLPASPISQGADIVVISAHKTLPTLTQGALLLANSDYVDLSRLAKVFDSTQTTSPSAAIIASIDASRALLQREGASRYAPLIEAVQRAREELSSTEFLEILDGPNLDPLKLVVLIAEGGPSGFEIERCLNEKGMEVETADQRMIIPQITIADTPEEIERLVEIIASSIQGDISTGRTGTGKSLWSVVPKVRVSPREAFFATPRQVKRSSAIGKISSELIAPYPPGVPVVSPGEEITQQALEILDEAKAMGIRIAYANDPTLSTFLVID